MSADAPSQLTLEISPDQANHLQSLFSLAKILSAPSRLAVLGYLAARPKASLPVAELATELKLNPAQLERDIKQMAEAGLIRIVEWQAAKPGREPVPAQVAFNPDYPKLMPPLIATLHRLNQQLAPAEESAALDERAKTVGTFLKNGRLVGLPAQQHRVVYLLEEVAKTFEPGVRYSERQVDAILKDIYEYDHCTLRRYLVDYKLLERAEGIYWRASAHPSPV